MSSSLAFHGVTSPAQPRPAARPTQVAAATPPWPGRVVPYGERRLRLEVHQVRLRWAEISWCRLTSCAFIADEGAIGRQFLLHVTQGSAEVVFSDRRLTVEEGAGVICRFREGDQVLIENSAQILSVSVPVRELPLFLRGREMISRLLPATPLLHGLGALVEILLEGGPVSPAHDLSAAMAVTDLTAAMMAEEVESEVARGTRASLAADLKAYVDSHLLDPELSADSIAATFDVSRRTVYNLLETEGVVLGRYLRELRLEGVLQCLEEERSVTVEDLARRFGFLNAAQLTRVFRDRFGMSISYYRQQGGAVEPV